MDYYYGIVLHLHSKATLTERISTEAFNLIYQNINQLCLNIKNYTLAKLI